MTPGQLRLELYDRNVTVETCHGRLRVTAPKGVLTPELISAIRDHEQALLEIIEAEQASNEWHERLYRLLDDAEARRQDGDARGADELEEQARRLVAGPLWDAGRRLLALLNDAPPGTSQGRG